MAEIKTNMTPQQHMQVIEEVVKRFKGKIYYGILIDNFDIRIETKGAMIKFIANVDGKESTSGLKKKDAWDKFYVAEVLGAFRGRLRNTDRTKNA